MNELINMSLDIHIFFIFLSILFAAVNMAIVKSVKDYVEMTKKTELFTPLYYISFSIVVFTGFVMWAVFRFRFEFTVYFMSLIAIIIVVGAFKSYKFFKKTRIKNLESQKRFREFAFKKYFLDILLMIFISFLAFIKAT